MEFECRPLYHVPLLANSAALLSPMKPRPALFNKNTPAEWHHPNIIPSVCMWFVVNVSSLGGIDEHLIEPPGVGSRRSPRCCAI